MSKKSLSDELKEAHKEQRKEKIQNSAFVLTIKGLWTFAEGAALIITSVFSIYQAYYGNFPQWGQYALIVSGALVLVPAGILLSKFFRAVGRG